jgi:hypothetical protein
MKVAGKVGTWSDKPMNSVDLRRLKHLESGCDDRVG